MKRMWIGCIALTAVLTIAAPAAPCDPQSKDNDAARQLRSARKFDAADKAVARILATRPDDFRARYTQALILIDRSGLDQAGKPDKALVAQGVEKLESAAALLDRIGSSCGGYARTHGWYGIWNTLGATYYNIGNMTKSEKALLHAYGLGDNLEPSTRAKLLNNLGLLYFARRQYDKSARYYDEAGRAGSAGADRRAATAREIGVFDAKFVKAPAK